MTKVTVQDGSYVDTPWIGEGSIKQIKPGKDGKVGKHAGKWRLQWIVVQDGKKVDVDKIFRLKGDATAWRDQKKVELRTGVRVEAVRARAKERLTVQAMFEELAGTREKEFRDGKWVRNGAAPQTVLTKFHRWNVWIKGTPIAERPVRALMRDDAYAHVDLMRERGATIATMTDVLGLLKKLTNDAIDEKPECKSLSNPFVRIALQTNEERAVAAVERRLAELVDGGGRVVLSPDDAAHGLAKARKIEERAILAVHLLGGLRLGEGMALCVEQLDFERAVIVVDRAVHLGASGKQYVGLPKRNKIRVVAMCPTLAAILENHVRSLPTGRKHLFGADRSDRPRMKYRYYLLWKAALASAELPEGLDTQGSRVSHNNWVEKLCPAVSVSTRLEHMGHSLRKEDGQPAGLGVNIKNYTAHIPAAYEILSGEIERVIGLDKT